MICIKKHNHRVKNLTENQKMAWVFLYKHYGLIRMKKKIDVPEKYTRILYYAITFGINQGTELTTLHNLNDT